MLHTMTPESGKLDRQGFHDFLHNSFGMTDDALMDKSKLKLNNLSTTKQNSAQPVLESLSQSGKD